MILLHSLVAGNFHGDVHEVVQELLGQLIRVFAAGDDGVVAGIVVGGRGVGKLMSARRLDRLVVRHLQLKNAHFEDTVESHYNNHSIKVPTRGFIK